MVSCNAIAAGAEEILHKPTSMKALEAAVCRYLRPAQTVSLTSALGGRVSQSQIARFQTERISRNTTQSIGRLRHPAVPSDSSPFSKNQLTTECWICHLIAQATPSAPRYSQCEEIANHHWSKAEPGQVRSSSRELLTDHWGAQRSQISLLPQGPRIRNQGVQYHCALWDSFVACRDVPTNHKGLIV